MKIEGWLFALGFVIFSAIAGVYWYLSHDQIGTTCLAMSAGLAFLVGFYVLITSKRVFPRPEDRDSAEIDEAEPEYGFFSPHSWWPLPVAFSAMLVALGLVFAAWLVVLGVTMLLLSLVGWLFEYYRGEFAQ
jgi:hypothetical protein